MKGIVLSAGSSIVKFRLGCRPFNVVRKSTAASAVLGFLARVSSTYSFYREGIPLYIFFLNPDYVAARSLRSLRSNHWQQKKKRGSNRPFARSGHMVRNKLHWDASYTVGLSKQRKVGLDWYEFLCFGSPTA